MQGNMGFEDVEVKQAFPSRGMSQPPACPFAAARRGPQHAGRAKQPGPRTNHVMSGAGGWTRGDDGSPWHLDDAWPPFGPMPGPPLAPIPFAPSPWPVPLPTSACAGTCLRSKSCTPRTLHTGEPGPPSLGPTLVPTPFAPPRAPNPVPNPSLL